MAILMTSDHAEEKMKKVSSIVLLLGIVFALSSCVVRSTAVDGGTVGDIPARIANQQQRIDHGVASGELTRLEANILHDNLNYVRGEYARMKADGLLVPREVNRLERLLEQNSQMIANKKHNIPRRLY
jgi:hypothetical protein